MKQLTVTKLKNIRVLTTQQLAEQYETDSETISQNFYKNKEKYQERLHYIILEGEEKRNFQNSHFIDGSSGNAAKFYLWTEKGCFLHAQLLNTDKALKIYGELAVSYFKTENIMPEFTNEIKELILHDKKIQAVVEHIQKTDDRLDKLEYDIPLYGCESKELSNHVKRKGVQVLGGKKMNAYKKSTIRGAIYRDIYDQVKREFGLYDEEGKKLTYLALKRRYLPEAHKCVKAYTAPLYLQEQIQNENRKVNTEGIRSLSNT